MSKRQGRKADHIWSMGDTKQIQLPKSNNPEEIAQGRRD
jgi:hypothetical protein